MPPTKNSTLSREPPRKETTAAIILGAQAFPRMPNFAGATQFAEAAAEFEAYLTSNLGMGLSPAAVINLFDSNDPADVQAANIENHLAELRKSQNLIDIIFYYVGHGAFGPNNEYYLAIRATRETNQVSSSMTISSLQNALKEGGKTVRRYIILDCCFAAAAVSAFVPQADRLTRITQEFRHYFPSFGTVLLCAAPSSDVAVYDVTARFTQFSGALLKVLTDNSMSDCVLSFHDLGQKICDYILDNYQEEGVRPEVHVPDQKEGSIATVPLMPIWRDHYVPGPDDHVVTNDYGGFLNGIVGLCRQGCKLTAGTVARLSVMATSSLRDAIRWLSLLGRALLTILLRYRWRSFALSILLIAPIASVLTYVELAVAELPSYEKLKSGYSGLLGGLSITVHGSDGSILGKFGQSNGEWRSLESMPSVVKAAAIAMEDQAYYSGILGRTIAWLFPTSVRVENTDYRRRRSGISSQLAEIIFLSKKSTGFDWYFRRLIQSIALERKFSKQELLELYLNVVPLPDKTYGIDAASKRIFGHGSSDLSLSEAGMLIGSIDNPVAYSPFTNKLDFLKRGKITLSAMVASHSISEEEVKAAQLGAISISHDVNQKEAKDFTDWALPQLDALVPSGEHSFDVWTTLDPRMQALAASVVQSAVAVGLQGALVSIDRDGAVRALVGARNAVATSHQAGSVWSLFVYLAALEAGVKPDDPAIDQPVNIDGWSPQNSGRSYVGQIDVRTAFAFSKNTVAAQLGQQVGFSAVAEMARRFGITSPINTRPSMVLGTSDVRLMDMVGAFAEVSAGGTSVQPFGITKVVTTDGRTLYEKHVVQGQTLVAPFVAAGMTDLLQTATNIGAGKAARIGRPVAGKAGTTMSKSDGWFLGFSSGLTTGVWMGHDPGPNLVLVGSEAPAKAWAAYMKKAVASRKVEQFATQVKLPEWQLEPDDYLYRGEPDTQARAQPTHQ